MIKISLSKCYIFIYFRHKMKKKFLLNSLCMFIILLSFHKYCQNYWYSPISSNSPVYCEIIVTKLWFMAWFLVFMTKMPYYQKKRVVPDPRICKIALEIFSGLHPYTEGRKDEHCALYIQISLKFCFLMKLSIRCTTEMVQCFLVLAQRKVWFLNFNLTN